MFGMPFPLAQVADRASGTDGAEGSENPDLKPCLTAGQAFQTAGLSWLGKPLLDLLDMPHNHIWLSSCQQN